MSPEQANVKLPLTRRAGFPNEVLRLSDACEAYDLPEIHIVDLQIHEAVNNQEFVYPKVLKQFQVFGNIVKGAEINLVVCVRMNPSDEKSSARLHRVSSCLSDSVARVMISLCFLSRMAWSSGL
ncbi:MAG: hypothetical protein CME25_17440 [Gemmatimonadetes bacterium]|nr:hypothetical protein [Gemmatimonadota bacterium]